MTLERATAKIQTTAWGLSPTIHVPPADHTSKGIRLAHSSALLLAGLIEDTIAHSMPAVGWIVYVERGGSVASVRIELMNETEADAAQALRLLQTVLEAARRLDERDAAKASDRGQATEIGGAGTFARATIKVEEEVRVAPLGGDAFGGDAFAKVKAAADECAASMVVPAALLIGGRFA